MIEWVGFLITIVLLLTLSRVNLGLSLAVGGLTLGLFTLTTSEILTIIFNVLTNPSVILLTAAVTLIPVIAGVMQISGQFDRIVENLRVGKRGFLGLSPSLLGLLPIPGGALFSAPLIKKAGENLSKEVKVGVNMWFRHVLYFVYPLTPALIISASVARLSMYTAILYLIPFSLISIAIGYFFFLRKAEGEMNYETGFKLKGLFIPLSVLLSAPIIDFTLQNVFNPPINEISILLGVSTSLVLAIYFAGSKISILKKSVEKMNPWNFTVIMIGIFIFINIFESSGIGSMIALLSPPIIVLSIGLGFCLGLITGRIHLSASILIPIFLATFGFNSLPPLIFAITYFSIFLGYVISPVHPCVGLTLEYFDAKLTGYLKTMLLPIGVGITIAFIVFVIAA